MSPLRDRESNDFGELPLPTSAENGRTAYTERNGSVVHPHGRCSPATRVTGEEEICAATSSASLANCAATTGAAGEWAGSRPNEVLSMQDVVGAITGIDPTVTDQLKYEEKCLRNEGY